MVGVDVVAPHEIGDGRLANVVGVNAPQEVVQQAFAQGAVGHGHAVDPECIEDGGRDGQPAGKNRRPLGVDRLEVDVVDVSGLYEVGLQGT